jgi:signal transduction histidine kinase
MLVLAVIASLFYLLKFIKNQKQLADNKNDLISNITHEFKTPIATIGVALEGIQNFDVLDDKEKTRSYLNVSSQQLEKLNLMVEKLLETASLDSNSLELDKSAEDLVALMNAITDRFTHQTEGKQFTFKTNIEQFLMEIDAFHFENAINNIVDNAVKYGGHEIAIVLEVSATDLSISITDNGPGIPSEHQKRIFDQFYRVPKGNTHDVKGFGIGLYYTQNIIQRHGGTITLESKPGTTQFKIHFNHVNH